MSGWILEIGPDIEPRLRRAQVSLCALANGTFAVVGDVDVDDDMTSRMTLVAGAYGCGPDGLVRPLPGPVWTALGVTDDRPHRWVLDLRSGTLTREPLGEGLRVVRFTSLARPEIGALRAEAPSGAVWAQPLTWPRSPAPLAAMHWWSRERSGEHDVAETGSDGTTVVVAARQQERTVGDRSRLDRVAAVASGPTTAALRVAERALDPACDLGFDGLLDEHRAAWDERWRYADVEIDGDPESQFAVRFALFHLLSSAATEGEAAVGARGLTGLAYAGHVFWDTDVYVLPALAAILPDAARAVLEYRVRRLPAARAAAAARGLPGARFPWESADVGDDVTPRAAFDLDGRLVEIHTGDLAEHITSDVAWAALHYVDWTGDDGFLAGPGRSLVVETARYLEARIRMDEVGRGHLDGVIGPDEYHVGVDDNAYTNGLARWHLRRAAELLHHDGDRDAARLEQAAAALVDGYDPATLRHEQFAGAWALDPVRIADLAEVPVAADVLLGAERAAASRVLKQADVLMLHHLLDDEMPVGSLAADLEAELPHISHGSSLSPAICASVLARAGRPDEGMPLFDLAARMDLDDLTQGSALGLHLATMGGLWQAVVFGFAGIRPTPAGLRVRPNLPTRWRSLRVHLRYRGLPVTVEIDHGSVVVDAPAEVPVLIAGRTATAPVRHPT